MREKNLAPLSARQRLAKARAESGEDDLRDLRDVEPRVVDDYVVVVDGAGVLNEERLNEFLPFFLKLIDHLLRVPIGELLDVSDTVDAPRPRRHQADVEAGF